MNRFKLTQKTDFMTKFKKKIMLGKNRMVLKLRPVNECLRPGFDGYNAYSNTA